MKQIPIAIVGLNFGRLVIEGLLDVSLRKRFRIAAVCDLDRVKAERMGRQLKCKAYMDLDALLADRDVSVIGLFTKPEGRAKLLTKIIRAGKDAMTTKPFESDPKAALEVLREAKRRGRIIHLNSPAPLPSPDLEQIVRWRDEFNLGRPVAARAETWVHYREKADGGWYDDPRHCPVAPVFRLGIYLINDLIRFFGEPRDVQIFQSRLFTQRPTADNAQLGIRFQNGGLANVFCSFCVDDLQHYRNSLTLNFERGTVYRNVGPFPYVPGNEQTAKMELVTRRGRKPVVRRRRLKRGLSGDYQWEIFHEALCGSIPDGLIPPEEIVAGIKILAAMAVAEKSAKSEIVSSQLPYNHEGGGVANLAE
jgi:predicted dehydrogenase